VGDFLPALTGEASALLGVRGCQLTFRMSGQSSTRNWTQRKCELTAQPLGLRFFESRAFCIESSKLFIVLIHSSSCVALVSGTHGDRAALDGSGRLQPRGLAPSGTAAVAYRRVRESIPKAQRVVHHPQCTLITARIELPQRPSLTKYTQSLQRCRVRIHRQGMLLVSSAHPAGLGEAPLVGLSARKEFTSLVEIVRRLPVGDHSDFGAAGFFFFAHRAATAFLPISLRCSVVSFFIRAAALSLPPLAPCLRKNSSAAFGILAMLMVA
jgi:hypothetical protein